MRLLVLAGRRVQWPPPQAAELPRWSSGSEDHHGPPELLLGRRPCCCCQCGPTPWRSCADALADPCPPRSWNSLQYIICVRWKMTEEMPSRPFSLVLEAQSRGKRGGEWRGAHGLRQIRRRIAQ